MASSYSIGDYLIHSLHGRGITHIFGVPGDYILSFYDRITKSKISVVNTCDEQGAGFAADAYARIRGLGVVCITYGVGALKVINTTAQAYAEALQTSISAAATALVVQAPTLTAVAINRYNALHPEPKSSPAEMNKPYDFSLFTHCGVDFSTDFDGSFWDAADKTNRPRSLDYDFQRGTMTLVDESHARFDFEGGSVLFVRHTGPKVLPGVCQ